MVIVAAMTVGSLEAVKTVKHLGKDQFTLVITDDPTRITPDATGQDIRTSTSEPSTAMFRGNAARTGVYPSGGPIDPPELLWKFKTGEGEGSSPAVSDGTVYVGGSDRYLYALDAQSGEEKWKFLTDYGVTSSPAVSDGVVYFGSWDGYLYALDARNGREKWKFLAFDGIDPNHWVAPGYAPTASSPAVSDGVVYFVSDSEFLYALDTTSGREKWRFRTREDEIRSPLNTPSNHSSPAVSDGVVYFGSDEGFLYAVDAQSGQEKWSFQAGDEIRSSPAVSDGVVYFVGIEYDPIPVPGSESAVVGAGRGYLYALDAQSGKEKWRSRVEDFFSSPAVSDGVVYFFGHADNPQPLDAGGGGRSVVDDRADLSTPCGHRGRPLGGAGRRHR